MFRILRTRGGVVLALGGAGMLALCVVAVLALAGTANARHPIPYHVDPPPPVITPPPPPVVPPPPPGGGQGCQGGDCGHGCDCGCDNPPPPGTPPGGQQHAPEPATLLSGLVGVGLAGVYALRRRMKKLAA